MSEPVTVTGFFAILVLFCVFLKRGAPAWGAALGTALVSPALTALVEATWYALVRHIDFWQVLGANFDPDMAYRPSAAPRGRRRRAAGAIRQPLKRISETRTGGQPSAARADF